MKWAWWVGVTASVLLSACVRTGDGVPVAADPNTAGAPAPSSRTIPTPQAELDEPGVLPTEKTQIPAPGHTCATAEPPPVGTVAAVADPAAPRITVALPTGWAVSKGEGDVGARLTGPDGASGAVTIAVTTLDPAAAFKKYADDAMAAATMSTVSVLPADLCGYSGQKLLGTWSGGQTVEFGDRLAHIWTNTDNYLVAVHIEGSAGFEPLTSPLLGDFGIEIP
ncbi:hypothetical protein [Mycolicibacterium sp. XJ1819]